MTTFNDGLDEAFRTAAAELGMCSAARLFTRELVSQSTEVLTELRDRLGRGYPVLDAVVEAAQQGESAAAPDCAELLPLLAGLRRLLLVGFEADYVDALMPVLAEAKVKVGLVRTTTLDCDFERLASNYGGALHLVAMEDVSLWAGSRSALLTFTYGVHGDNTHVAPAWLRVAGDDVRPMFRSLIGWDVLKRPMSLYPRWLTEVSASIFTELL